ncbi:MAG TPA: DNA-directed RNA polymerase subunit alpha C-terminal domain-containing protein [Candidatus Brocadiia bacterium]|nr:DNA-directed RNA polymerase subunit alpha C-terminal domain-containing protein [Candidatus Brocadiia bacterium]
MHEIAASPENIERFLADEELSRDQVYAAKLAVCADPKAYRKLHTKAQELREAVSSARDDEARRSLQIRLGICLCVMGQHEDMVPHMEETRQRRECAFWLGYAALMRAAYSEAAAMLAKSLRGDDDAMTLALLAEAQMMSGDASGADKTISILKKSKTDSADVAYLNARAKEIAGDYADAIAGYEAVLQKKPDHPGALFRLAQNLDMNGEDQKAIELYERLAALQPTYMNALVNLGILYEDHGRFEEADKCYRQVLKVNPAHARAKSFLKDTMASLTMHIDEHETRKRIEEATMLQTPISEFELSVRSRNCLERMNIRTLGDLTRVTEAQLLSYKNFGETSLNEIRQMLESRHLTLGQPSEQEERQESKRKQLEMADQEVLNRPVSDLNLSGRSRRCMETMAIQRLGDLVKFKESDLLEVRNFGQTSINEIKRKLAQFGLALAQES